MFRCAHRYVVETAPDCVWVATSPQLRGRLHALDCCDDPQDMAGFASGFQLGQKLRCYVLKVSTVSNPRDNTPVNVLRVFPDSSPGKIVLCGLAERRIKYPLRVIAASG